MMRHRKHWGLRESKRSNLLYWGPVLTKSQKRAVTRKRAARLKTYQFTYTRSDDIEVTYCYRDSVQDLKAQARWFNKARPGCKLVSITLT